MTREAAVALFESEGFRSCVVSDAVRGEMVVAGIPRGDGSDADEGEMDEGARPKVVHVFPIKEEWGIFAPGLLLTVNWKRHWPMERACEVAMSLLRCDELPIGDRDILIHHVRAVGGGYWYMEHVATGIKKAMTRPGGEALLTKEEALDEIVFELALREEE